jgi:hypothetical protein
VCVHRDIKTTEKQTLGWLSALEMAYERLVYALRLPSPLDDGAFGGGPEFDLYLTAGTGRARAHIDAPDPTAHFDTSSAFCTVGGGAIDRDRAATLCVGEAIGARLDAAETPFARRALATELWFTLGTPTGSDALVIDDAQAAPERAVAGREASAAAEGGGLLLDYLDSSRGRGDPVGAALATFALAAGPKSPVAWRFTNEPDTMDVLRTTFGPTPSDVARFFADFAVARAFLGSRDIEASWPTLAWAGELGRVRFEWNVPFSSLPRQLAPARPVEPTGSTYLWVSLDESVTGVSLAFQADWEPPVAFRWVVILVDGGGRLLRRIDVPFLERETHVERLISDLSGATGVLIAGINLGGLGPSYPFDPDFEPFEPHGYTVSLSKQ